jgi:hypothetical protein
VPLRLALQYADGTVATNLQWPRFDRPDEEPIGPILMSGGGGGGGHRYDQQYWVHPLPPPGPIKLYCQWPAHGIDETSVEFDGELIRTAAARAVRLWPEHG